MADYHDRAFSGDPSGGRLRPENWLDGDAARCAVGGNVRIEAGTGISDHECHVAPANRRDDRGRGVAVCVCRIRKCAVIVDRASAASTRLNDEENMRLLPLLGRLAAACVALCPMAAGAQIPADFYRGRSIDLYIGYSAGGGYDVYARALARHMG